MKTQWQRLSLGMLLWLLAQPSGAEGNSASLNPAIKVDPCRSEVSRFEETIGYLRQVQGNTAAAAIKEKLLPSKLENEILFKEGYCGLARYIKEKKLNR
jgi:hypothetical protein